MGPTEKRAALEALELFHGLLSPQELDALAALCTWRNFDRDQEVVSQDSPGNDVYFVARGRVRVTIFAAGGQEVAFRDLGAGKSFGELSAIDGQARSASVVALEPSWIATLSRERFWTVLREHPSITQQLLRQLAALIRNLTERVVEFSTLAVRNRIQAELVRMAREAGVVRNQATLAPAPRHADIASRVSTNREAVARELAELARKGLVQKRPGALILLDVKRLAAMVDDVRAG
ncbi:MAG TPA: Crp/Fnr family transcriptional regulator [Alphaproteobacteria bacterium]|nr:Crp/Fnr family transcriptional regulator [Alphaproteobacteria bacterium]